MKRGPYQFTPCVQVDITGPGTDVFPQAILHTRLVPSLAIRRCKDAALDGLLTWRDVSRTFDRSQHCDRSQGVICEEDTLGRISILAGNSPLSNEMGSPLSSLTLEIVYMFVSLGPALSLSHLNKPLSALYLSRWVHGRKEERTLEGLQIVGDIIIDNIMIEMGDYFYKPPADRAPALP